MTILKVGIAGHGVVGQRRKACVDKNPSVNVVAVCDHKFPDNGVMDNGVRYYYDYRELLKEDLDILIVCLTNEVASEVTIAGLKKGLHVFCEKPPGRGIKDIQKVVSASSKYPNLKLMYGFNHRYHDSVQDALKLIKSGDFGNIINIRGVYGKSKLITFNQSDWRTKREIAGGGVLLDQGIHMVDLIRLFAGEFDEVYSFISNNHWRYDVEDNAYALMKSKSGIVAMMNSSATQWRHRFNLDINLDKGSIILGGILSSSKSYGAETLTVINADPDSDNGDPREQVIFFNRDPSWDAEISVFANAIIDDTPIISGSVEDALNTMKLVYRIYYADKLWREKFSIENPDF